MLPPHSVEDGFGVGAFVSQRSDTIAPLTIGRVRLLGAGWVREEFTANALHSGPRTPFSWRSYDRVIDAERRAGLQVLGLLDYSNTWSYGNHANVPHRHLAHVSADFARFAYAVVKHYRGRIRFWQIWNEPDLVTFWRPRPNPADYAALLHAAYRSVKRANPGAKVVLAGLSGMDLPFLRQVTQRTNSFDVVAMHPYRGVPETELIEEVQALHSLHRPIWFSEIGWAAGDGCPLCTERDAQARNLVRFYALALALGVQRIFWYDLRDDVHNRRSPEAHFGLLRRDLAGKPAFAAYQALAHLLRGASFVAAAALDDDGLYVLRFRSSRGELGIAWNTGDEPRTAHLPWREPIALALNFYGGVHDAVKVSDGYASWSIPPDGEPEYLVSDPVGLAATPPGPLLRPPPPLARPRARARHIPSSHRRAPKPAHRPAQRRAHPRAQHGARRSPVGVASGTHQRPPTPPPPQPTHRERSLPVRPSPTATAKAAATPGPTATEPAVTPSPAPTPTASSTPTEEPSPTPEATPSPTAP